MSYILRDIEPLLGEVSKPRRSFAYPKDKQKMAALLRASDLLEHPELLGQLSIADKEALAYAGIILSRMLDQLRNPEEYTGGRPEKFSAADRKTYRFQWLAG